MTKYKIIYNFGGSNLQIKIDNFNNQIKMIIPFTYPSSDYNKETNPDINFYYPKYEKNYIENIIYIRKKFNEIISNLQLSLPSSTSLPLSTLKESTSSSTSLPSLTSIELLTEIDNKYSKIFFNIGEKKTILMTKINAFSEVFMDLSTNLYTQKINNFNIYDQIRYEKGLGFSFQIQGLLNHNEDPNCYTLVKTFKVDNYNEPVGCCSVIALKDINKDEELTISHYLSYEDIYNILYQHNPQLLINFKNVRDYTKIFFEYKNMSKPYLQLLNYLLSMDGNENQIIQRINEQCNFFQIQSILLLKLLLNNRNRIKFKNKDQFPEQISIELEENKKLKDIVLANDNGDGRFLLEDEYEIIKIYNSSFPMTEGEFEKSIDKKIKTVFSDYLFNLNFFTEISIINRKKNNDKYIKIERILKILEENSIIYKFIDNQKNFLLDSEITKIISHIADS